MTRLSKRELERRIDDLECWDKPNTDATLMILPDHSFDAEDLPDVSTEGIRVYDEETDRLKVAVPHHRPEQWFRDGLPLVAESNVAAVWHKMDSEQLARERQFREKYDEPIPPILEERQS